MFFPQKDFFFKQVCLTFAPRQRKKGIRKAAEMIMMSKKWPGSPELFFLDKIILDQNNRKTI